jgi:flagellar biosynthetic protein FliQ
MEQAQVLGIMQDAITTIIVTAAPMLIVAMVVGVIVSIFQATTQINEQTLAFVPKIIAIFLTILIFGGWIVTNITEFIQRAYQLMGTAI